MSKKIIKNLFNYALKEGASDLVITDAKDSLAIAYRFPDGSERFFDLPKKIEENLVKALRQLLMISPGELTVQKPCKISAKNQNFNFYLSILPDQNQEKIIIKIINKSSKNWRLKQLGLQLNDLRALKTSLKKRSGLILVSSPVDAGKSATLLALAQEINKENLNTYILEKNPSSRIPGINYLEPTPANWSSVLRHDSDLFIVDDLAAPENLRNALRAAGSGRLVLGALKADSSFEALYRSLTIDLPWKSKIDSLKLIVNQRVFEMKRKKTLRKKIGRQTIGVFEILDLNPSLKEILLAGEKEFQQKNFWKKFLTLAQATGFRPLAQDLSKKIKDGFLDQEKHL